MNIVQKPVINHDSGRFGYKPEAIVIHISQGTLFGMYSWFNNSASKSSSHFGVGKNGEVDQFVNTDDTAWHAGGISSPHWSLLKPGVNPNLYTIGIEHEGFTGQVWSDAMYNATAELIGNLCRQYGIPLDRNHIIGHCQIDSTSRAQCPGTGVNFDKLIQLANTFYSQHMDQINQQAQQIKDLQAAYNLAHSQAVDAHSQLDENGITISNLNSQLEDLQKQFDALKTENYNLTQQITSLTNDNQKLNSIVSSGYQSSIWYQFYLLFNKNGSNKAQ